MFMLSDLSVFVNMEHRGNEIESTIFPMLAAEGRVGAYKDDAH